MSLLGCLLGKTDGRDEYTWVCLNASATTCVKGVRRTMRFIALYTRVSTEEQAAEGNSLAEQAARLTLFCESNGLKAIRHYADDGVSAKNMNRPALKKLSKDIAAGEIERVVTTRIDRLSRNLLDLLQFVDFLREYDCRYQSVLEPFDTITSEGRLMFQLLGTFAEFERARIGERVKDNMLHVARGGGIVKPPPFGYKVANGKYAIDPEKANWYRFMVQRLLEGRGTFQIAAEINRAGVTTKRGGLFQARDIRRILQNDFYLGRTTWNRSRRLRGRLETRPQTEWITVSGTHPPLIDADTFDSVCDALKRKSQLSSRAKSSPYLLTGILYCGHCGSKMAGHSATHKNVHRHPLYVCQRYTHTGACHRNAVSANALEQAVLQAIAQFLADAPPLTDRNLREARRSAALSECDRGLRAVCERRARLLAAYEAGVLDLEVLRLHMERLRLEEQGIEAKRSQWLATEPSRVTPEQWRRQWQEALSALARRIEVTDIARVKALLALVVCRVTVCDRGEDVEIQLSPA